MVPKVISKFIALPARDLSPRVYVHNPYSDMEVVSEIRVQWGKKVLTARATHNKLLAESIPLEVIERDLQDQICREISKALFGN